MKLTLRLGLLIAWPLLAATAALAQPTRAADGTPQLIQLSAKTGAALRQLPLDSRQLLRQELALRPADDLRPLRTETDELGQLHERFQQYYNGVKVEHGVYTVHRAAGVLSGELKPVPAALSIKPALHEEAALRAALAAVGARRYIGEELAQGTLRRSSQSPATYRPGGELVLVEDYRQGGAAGPLVLAWKFNIYAEEPLSRAYVYVNARTGAVVLQDAIIKHAAGLVEGLAARAVATRPTTRPAAVRGGASAATGTFATRYMGTRQAGTDLFNGSYRLRDYTRAAGVETFNLRTGTNTATAVDFTDNDNNWTAAELDNAAKDNAALDAHFGSQATYDYWMTTHGRNSINGTGGKFINYVHLRVAFDNAFWDGSAMSYGDGGSLFRPLTALDVCGHETGHGICQATANLVYANESGALNEGFSDIWGAAVEYSVDPSKQTWIVGEDITLNAAGLRSMSDPLTTSVLSPSPANYRGQRWAFGTADNGGVHTNSGVLNHWFYMLSVGKTGINEQQQAYSVTGITLEKAARIAYRAERLYLTPNSDYRSTRVFTIQAATDLYGANSAEVAAVTNAWYAVGLGASSAAATGTQAQCQPDDAPVLTAAASSASVCAGEPLNLTATATYPATRRLRNSTATALPDAATGYTSLTAYYNLVAGGTTLQHGLETVYRNYSDLVGVRVRLSHAQPGDVTLRLNVRNTSGTTSYVTLATALPTAASTAAANTLDLTFADNAASALPATMSGNTLIGTYQPTTPLASIAPGTLTFVSLESKDGVAGNTGAVLSVELLFRRLAADVPSVRWVGPGLDAPGLTATIQPAGPPSGGTVAYHYTVLASDPYFGCTSSQSLSVNVSQPLLAAAALQTDLCAGRGQAFSPIDLRVTANDSLPGQLYLWSGPNGYGATGKRLRTTAATGGRLRYTVSTVTPGSNCSNQKTVAIVARRPVAAAPAGSDSVACAGTTTRLRSRPFENQLAGSYRFTGSVSVPDNSSVGVRIPLTVTGTPEGFFNLRGIQLNMTHTYDGDMTLYVIAPDGTRVLLSLQNGGSGHNFQNTLFIDSVGARALGSGAAPFAGTWQVDEPTGFSKLAAAPQVGTWNLFAVDGGPADLGVITSWGLVTRDNGTIWSGPNGLTASGSDVLVPVPATAGRYRYIGLTTVPGGCTFRDTVEVRVAPGPAWQPRQNTDLALAANWTCLPTSTTDAEVRGAANAQPVLSAGLVQVRNLTLRANTALALDGGTLEVYGTLTLEAGASIGGSSGTLALRGAAVVLNAPTSTALNIPRLLVNLPAATDTARLTQRLTVDAAATLQRGILKTQAADLKLLPGATITETADAYVSGRLLAAGALGTNTSQSFGGVGLTLSQASASLSSVSLTRVTDQAIGRAPARTGIRRHYTLGYVPTIVVSATVRLGYRDAELNGLAETDLQPFRAGSLVGPWVAIARTAQNTTLNYVDGSGDISGTWTLSTPTAMLPTRSATTASFAVQALPVPFGAAGFALALQTPLARRAASVEVFDLAGRRLLQRRISVAAGLSSVALPEAGPLAAGVYLVRVLIDGEARTLRVSRE